MHVSRKPLPHRYDPYRLLTTPRLLMHLLGELRHAVPVPYALAINTLAATYGRAVTTKHLSVILAHERNAWGRQHGLFLAPALRPDGTPARGWLTRSDWMLHDRIIPYESDGDAHVRSCSALAGAAPVALAGITEAVVNKASKDLRRLPLREQIFGVRP